MNQALLAAGAISGAIAVAAGAFGAHALKDRLTEKALSIFETAARYQMYHALAIVLCAALAGSVLQAALPSGSAASPERLRLAAGALAAGGWFVAGTVVFSGSLYALALTDVKILGAITPLGGVAFLIGWIWLAISALR